MSDTPETDKQERDWCWQDAVPVDFARKLERERDAARTVLGEFLASGVEYDDPRMDYITMQIDRVTLAAARAAEEER